MFFVVLFVSVGVFTFNAEAGAPKCPSANDDTSILLQDKDCSKYWRCLNGNADLLECPNGLYFNKKTNSCNSPHKALCSEDESSEELDSDEIEDILKYDNNIYRTCNTSEIHCPAEDDEQPVYFPLPNCTQFCQCSNGVPYLHDCPADLHFNPALNVCDNPQNAGCANGNSTDDSSTTSTESSGDDKNNSATTTKKGGPTIENDESYELCPDTVTNECPAVDGEHPVYIPLPNCSQFCHCSNGLPYLHNCPDDLHFNPVLKVCDRPEDAGCARGNDVISTTEGTGGEDNQPSPTTESSESNETDKATTTEKSATTTGSDESYELCHDTITNECPEVDGEHPVYIPLPNCSQFCQCSNGLPYLHNCPDDLHFNPVLNVCDWPGDAGCAGGNDVISTTEGTGGDDGGDDNQPSPTTESSESNETDKATTTEKSATTTGSDESYELCHDTITNECPAVDGEHPVYIPLPNCSQFCQCSNGLPYLHNCPGDLHFDPVLNVCDWPGDAGCAGGNDVISTTEGTGGEDTQPSPTTESSEGNETDKATTEKSVTTTDSDESYELCPDTVTNECPAVDGEHPVYIPLPNCSQFCQCSNGLPYLHNCPDDLHFNPVLNVCDWPGDAGCAGGNDVISTTEGTGGEDTQPSPTTDSSGGDESDFGTTTEDSVSTTVSEYMLCLDTVENKCPAVDGEHPVYIPLPNCTQFCQCSNGLPYLHYCPSDLHFNPVLNVCDYKENAGCASNNGTYSTLTTVDPGNKNTDASATTERSEDQETDRPVTTKSSTSTTESAETIELCPDTVENVCPPVDGEYPVYMPLPNCAQFCQCSNGLPYLHNCSDGLHFNALLNVCDYPQSAQCDSIPS
ncbi:uncharacterized protein LOC108914575 [Anoplophora glabripennis]|uniref:uncharacterized protein LOC108914575 n=1 Tax=Anoplophora glabripennis TaxID=217634 RepID=UPI000C7601D7|nr:uncharacterized protein LOC108914575 [Anoplophora glabripennis]